MTRWRRHIDKALRSVARIQLVEEIEGESVTDLKMIAAGYRSLDRKPVYKATLDHVGDTLIDRAGSLTRSKIVASCAYHLILRLGEMNTDMGYTSTSPALGLLARKCDTASGGNTASRAAMLVTCIGGDFRRANRDTVFAIASTIARCVELKAYSNPRSCSASLALTLAMSSTREVAEPSFAQRHCDQLEAIAESDGFRVVAAMFRAGTDFGGTDEQYFERIRHTTAAAQRVRPDDPAAEIVSRMAHGMHVWEGQAGPDDPEGLAVAKGAMTQWADHDYRGAAETFDRATDLFANDPYWRAVTAIFAFYSKFRTFHGSSDITSNELAAAIDRLAANDFAVARGYWDCSQLLGYVLHYCHARADEDSSFRWLAARVADLIGEYVAGSAISEKENPLARHGLAAEASFRDVLARHIEFQTAESLKTMVGTRAVIWVNQVELHGGPDLLVTAVNGRDKEPICYQTLVRSDEGRRLFEEAATATLGESKNDLAKLRSWIVRRPTSKESPLLFLPDRKCWAFPWSAIAPAECTAVAVMPSLASASRLPIRSMTACPVVAGFFDTDLAGARAELAALERLDEDGAIVLRRANSIAALSAIVDCGDVSILTISVHGTSGDGFQYRLLFPDSSTAPAGLMQLPLPSIVVLGACWSARLSEQADSMATAIGCLAAGASAVVGALWDVDDEVAGTALAAFYTDVAAGNAPAHALRKSFVSSSMEDGVAASALAVLGAP